MRMILAYENSLSRDFAASHLAGSDPLLDIHPAASLAQSITLANRLDRLDVVARDVGLPPLDARPGPGRAPPADAAQPRSPAPGTAAP